MFASQVLQLFFLLKIDSIGLISDEDSSSYFFILQKLIIDWKFKKRVTWGLLISVLLLCKLVLELGLMPSIMSTY